MYLKIFTHLFIGCCLMALASFISAANYSPDGNWIQISDVTGKPHSIIKIITKDNILYGTVVKGFPVDGKMPSEYCLNCPGKFRNQKVPGMTILWGAQQKYENQWINGKILDPNNGKIYHCILTLVDEGKKLELRGYVGVSLFGRTQTWVRAKE